MTFERRSVAPSLAIGFASLVLVPSCSSARSDDAGTDEHSERIGTTSAPSLSTTAVVTHHNDNRRSGSVSNETKLNVASVRSSFGLVGRTAVDGQIYAQPLYVGGLTIGSAVHNVVFVATEKSSIYAIDADTMIPLWTHSLLDKGETSVPGSDHYDPGYATLWPDIGITGTPVIDVSTDSLYVVAVSKKERTHRLHIYIDSSSPAESIRPPRSQGRSPMERASTSSTPTNARRSSSRLTASTPMRPFTRRSAPTAIVSKRAAGRPRPVPSSHSTPERWPHAAYGTAAQAPRGLLRSGKRAAAPPPTPRVMCIS